MKLSSDADTLPPGGPVEIAIEIAVPAGSKTYWHAPGLSGLPTRIDWSESENVDTVELHWQTPTRMIDPALPWLSAIGYPHGMIVIARATPKDRDRPMIFNVDLELGVCEDVCIVDYATTRLSLAPQRAARFDAPGLISALRARLPGPNGSQGLTLVRTERSGDERIVIEARSDDGFDDPDLFAHDPEPACNEKRDWIALDRHVARFFIPARCVDERGQTTATLVDGPRAVTATLPVAAGSRP